MAWAKRHRWKLLLLATITSAAYGWHVLVRSELVELHARLSAQLTRENEATYVAALSEARDRIVKLDELLADRLPEASYRPKEYSRDLRLTYRGDEHAIEEFTGSDHSRELLLELTEELGWPITLSECRPGWGESSRLADSVHRAYSVLNDHADGFSFKSARRQVDAGVPIFVSDSDVSSAYWSLLDTEVFYATEFSERVVRFADRIERLVRYVDEGLAVEVWYTSPQEDMADQTLTIAGTKFPLDFFAKSFSSTRVASGIRCNGADEAAIMSRIEEWLSEAWGGVYRRDLGAVTSEFTGVTYRVCAVTASSPLLDEMLVLVGAPLGSGQLYALLIQSPATTTDNGVLDSRNQLILPMFERAVRGPVRRAG